MADTVALPATENIEVMALAVAWKVAEATYGRADFNSHEERVKSLIETIVKARDAFLQNERTTEPV
ncbi:MAG TPA: hypothetical protein VFF68_10035 [Anaerolineaceae bacterium]|nr:hypothetical protein [Anaerolineaceae bacterium]